MKLKRTHTTVAGLSLLLAIAQLPAPAQPAGGVSADPYQSLVKREFGTAVDEMTAIEKQIQAAKPEEFPAIETRLMAVLDNKDSTMPGKQFACQMLRLVGSPRCVSSVAPLLTDELLSHVARDILLGMTDASAGQALRDALPKAPVKARIGIINTIGDRGDSGSIPALSGLLANGDEDVATAVVTALGKMRDIKAADALDAAKIPEAVKTAWAQAYLRNAGGLNATGQVARAQKMYKALLDGAYPSQIRAGALREIVAAQKEAAVPLVMQTLASPDKWMKRAALSAVITMPGKPATAAFAKQLPALAPELKASLVYALMARGDGGEGVAELLNKFAASDDTALREASIESLGRLGNASSVPVLVAALKDGANSQMAMKSLAALRGDGVAESLVKQAEAGDNGLRANLLGVLADRRQVEALPVARNLTASEDARLRDAAVKVISAMGTQEDLQSLSELILTKKNDGERDALARAIIVIGNRTGDRGKRDDSVLQAFQKADAPTKVQLMPVLVAFSGDRALQAARGALAEPGDVHKAAVRSLAQWPDAAPLADLRTIAKDDGDATVRVLALRGMITMVGKSNMRARDKIDALREAMGLSTRTEEKRQVLGEVARIGQVDSLKIVEPFLNEDALKREAVQAYEQIAESLVDREPAIAKEALQKVLAATNDAGLRDKAQAALIRIK